MYIKGEWYTETEVQAYVAKLEEEILRLKEILSRESEEEYE